MNVPLFNFSKALALLLVFVLQFELHANPTLGWGPSISTGLNLYVSPDGKDDNDGSLTAPWLSIAKAQAFIRDLKTGAGLPVNGVIPYEHIK